MVFVYMDICIFFLSKECIYNKEFCIKFLMRFIYWKYFWDSDKDNCKIDIKNNLKKKRIGIIWLGDYFFFLVKNLYMCMWLRVVILL